VRRTFHRAFSRLRPKGVISLEINVPPRSSRITDRAGLWTGKWNRTADGAILAMRMLYTCDPRTHVRSSIMVFERYVDGRLEVTEQHETAMRFWEIDEVAHHLSEAGFVDIVTTKVFTDDEPPADHEWLAVRARRP
jgi:hypothetical protein